MHRREFSDKAGRAMAVGALGGGAIAQSFVARHPERVRSLLLTNCDTEKDSPPAVLLPVIEMSRACTFADSRFPPQLADKSFARSPRGTVGLFYSDPAHPMP